MANKHARTFGPQTLTRTKVILAEKTINSGEILVIEPPA
jgi:hypothetical protein